MHTSRVTNRPGPGLDMAVERQALGRRTGRKVQVTRNRALSSACWRDGATGPGQHTAERALPRVVTAVHAHLSIGERQER